MTTEEHPSLTKGFWTVTGPYTQPSILSLFVVRHFILPHPVLEPDCLVTLGSTDMG